MNLKLWIFNQYALAPDQAGITRHYALAQVMQEHDVQTLIFASGLDYITKKDTRLGTRQLEATRHFDGVEFKWLRTLPYQANGVRRALGMISFAFSAFRAAMAESRCPDVVLGSSPQPFAALAGYLVARRYRVPFILEVRDIWPQSVMALGGVSPRHPFVLLLSVLERFLYRRSDAIVSPLQGAYEHIRRVAGRDVVFSWLPNGAELSGSSGAHPPSDRAFTVMYAGAHGVANALDTVVRAAAQLKQRPEGQNVRLVMVGDGSEKAALIRLAAELGADNLEFRDPVPKTEVPALLASCHICLMPLKDSPLFEHGVSPNKLFDYFSAERPVIFSVRTTYNAVAQAGAGLSILPENPVAMADAILALAAMTPEQRQEMGMRGRLYVERHHNMRGLAAQLANLLWLLRTQQKQGER